MRYKIALIEDDELIKGVVSLALSQAGYETRTYTSAEQFLQSKETEVFDVIILDILLPGVPGTKLLEELRRHNDDTPILILSVRKDLTTRIKALEAGADDYLVKPFNMEELLARVKALIRRSTGQRRIPSTGVITINGFRVDIASRTCESRQGQVVLSEKEMRLLLFLKRRSRETLTRADILEEIWGMDVAPTPRTVDNFIMKFRKLFEDDPKKPKVFLSVRGQGYRFED
jgi:two-component system alkaline phosphatase synthesis response regulator PhoP